MYDGPVVPATIADWDVAAPPPLVALAHSMGTSIWYPTTLVDVTANGDVGHNLVNVDRLVAWDRP